LKAKGRDEEGQDVRKKDSTVHNEEFLSHKKNEVSSLYKPGFAAFPSPLVLSTFERV
jgi:hypothetical protein